MKARRDQTLKRSLALAGVCALAFSAVAVGIQQPAFADTYSSIPASSAYVDWSIPNAPKNGLTNITFPITVNIDTTQSWNTYYAQQFGFTNVPNSSPDNPLFPSIGYTGIIPLEQRLGHQRLSAKFSSFIAETKSSDPNCTDGIDGGPGLDCIVSFDGVYGHTYDLTVAQDGTDTWTGSALDTTTGISTHIGTYTLPKGSGKLGNAEAGFVEYFTHSESCLSMPAVDVVFGAPRSTDAGGLSGSTQLGDYQPEDANCPDPYTYASTGDSTRIIRNTGPWQAATGTITGVASGKCLDVTKSNTADKTPIQLYHCNKTKAQRWTLKADHTVRAFGKCLDVGGPAPKYGGIPVQLFTCNGSDSQQWIYTAQHTLVNVSTSRCLDFEGEQAEDRSPAQLWECTHWSDQRWNIPTP